MGKRKKMLVPFCGLCDLRRLLAAALKDAGQVPAEVIFLRVNLPLCPKTGRIDCECLFSELKALQAQLASAPSAPVHARLDTMPGKTKIAIGHYTRQNKIDLLYTRHAPHLFKSPRSPHERPPAQ